MILGFVLSDISTKITSVLAEPLIGRESVARL
jgi:hypothetical protein